MAHVYGHADFFFNNMYFAHTNRKMIDEMANHATRIRRYQERHGVERVERRYDREDALCCSGAVAFLQPQMAADVLVDWVRKMTDAELPIADVAPPTGAAILVGRAAVDAGLKLGDIDGDGFLDLVVGGKAGIEESELVAETQE